MFELSEPLFLNLNLKVQMILFELFFKNEQW